MHCSDARQINSAPTAGPRHQFVEVIDVPSHEFTAPCSRFKRQRSQNSGPYGHGKCAQGRDLGLTTQPLTFASGPRAEGFVVGLKKLRRTCEIGDDAGAKIIFQRT